MASSRRITKAFKDGAYGCGLRVALGPFQFLANTKRWREACLETHQFIDGYVEKAVESRKISSLSEAVPPSLKGVKPFLYSLVDQIDDKEQIRNELLQAFFVSQDTTSVLVTNVFFLLSRHPDVWQKTQMEVRALSNALPTYEQLGKMSYLRKVINEGLRH